MKAEGLGWTRSEIRQAQLLEWIIPQQNSSNYVGVKAFYDNALADQDADPVETAWADLQHLGAEHLLDLALGGGIEGFDVRVTAEGREVAERRQAARANRTRRRAACRMAMLDWLCQQDAVSELDQPAREAMLKSSEHGVWHGQPFTEGDLDYAAAWLFRNGFVKGITTGEDAGPVRLYLTDAGLTCAERYDSNVDSYSEAQAQQAGGGFSLTVAGDNYGQMAAGHHARQEQHNTAGASAEDLRRYITALQELLRAHAPQAPGLEEQLATAMDAARDGAVDESVLERFGSWVVSVFKQGATNALVPAVSSTVTMMMLEAGKLTGHL